MPLPIGTTSLRRAIEAACLTLASWRPRLAAIIRAGPMGACYVLSSEPSMAYWTPAYHTDQARVVDVTGAGNAFMGGLGAALLAGHGVHEGKMFVDWMLTAAVLWGSVAASFTVEQDGLPSMKLEGDEEMWNGERPRDRLCSLRTRKI